MRRTRWKRCSLAVLCNLTTSIKEPDPILPSVLLTYAELIRLVWGVYDGSDGKYYKRVWHCIDTIRGLGWLHEEEDKHGVKHFGLTHEAYPEVVALFESETNEGYAVPDLPLERGEE